MYQECIKGKERETVMKKKLVSVVLAAAVAAGTLAGCGGSSTKDSTQAASAGGETTEKSSSDENITLRLKRLIQILPLKLNTAAAMVIMINWQPSWHLEQRQILCR